MLTSSESKTQLGESPDEFFVSFTRSTNTSSGEKNVTLTFPMLNKSLAEATAEKIRSLMRARVHRFDMMTVGRKRNEKSKRRKRATRHVYISSAGPWDTKGVHEVI